MRNRIIDNKIYRDTGYCVPFVAKKVGVRSREKACNNITFSV